MADFEYESTEDLLRLVGDLISEPEKDIQPQEFQMPQQPLGEQLPMQALDIIDAPPVSARAIWESDDEEDIAWGEQENFEVDDWDPLPQVQRSVGPAWSSDSDPIQEVTEAKEVNPLAPPPKKKVKISSILSNIVFYLILAFTLFAVFIISAKDNKPRDILGYSYFTVLTRSMQREIPKGSLVITKKVPAADIKINDTVTYFKDENTTITHKVVEIIEDYKNTGERAFRTKGVENPSPDKEAVTAGNVIGIVVFASPGVGATLAYVQNNVMLTVAIFAMLILLEVCLKVFFSNSKDTDEEIEVKKKRAKK